MGNVSRITADLRKVKNYVKDSLFPRIIFMFDDNQMKEGSWMHRDYMMNCRSLVGYQPEDNAIQDREVQEAYMNHLWTVMARDKSYKRWLSSKRSNAYQAVQDKFMREYRRMAMTNGLKHCSF